MRDRATAWRLASAAVAMLLAGVLAGALLASCKKERSLRELTLGLSWHHQSQFVGAYYADQHGLYAKEGLHVSFVPATLDRDPLDEFLAGKYDFVIAQPDKLIAARQKGHQVKAIAATYRIHPLVFITLESSGIQSPSDFRGKTIGVAYSEKIPLMTLLRKMSIDPSEVTIVKRRYDYKSLQNGEVDVQAAWVINELRSAREAGLKLNIISPYDYGITFYADVLTARASLIENEPELVQRFVRATFHGWTKALQDPEGSAQLALHYDPDLELAHELDLLKATAPLVHTGVDRIGWMRSQDWEEMIRALHKEGLIPERLDADEIFTTDFIEAVQQP